MRSNIKIIEEPYPEHVAMLKRKAIKKKNQAGNYQPGELQTTIDRPIQPSLSKQCGWKR